MTLTANQLQILQHALGLDQYGQGAINRNHFCAGGPDEEVCRFLVEVGYMREHPTTGVFPYYNCSVTRAGKGLVLLESPAPPKLTRSQRRYRDFLRVDTGRKFGEWLKDTTGAEVRR